MSTVTTEPTAVDTAAAIVKRAKGDHPKIKTIIGASYTRLTLNGKNVAYVNKTGRKGTLVHVPVPLDKLPAAMRQQAKAVSGSRAGIVIGEKQTDLAAKLIGIAIDAAAKKAAEAPAPARETRPTPANADSPPADTVKVEAALDGPAKPDPKTPDQKKTPAKK